MSLLGSYVQGDFRCGHGYLLEMQQYNKYKRYSLALKQWNNVSLHSDKKKLKGSGEYPLMGLQH